MAGVDVEVVVTPLPEATEFSAAIRRVRGGLSEWFVLVAAQGSGDALFEYLNCGGGKKCGGLVDYEVHMLGHDYVAYECECIFGADFRQYLDSGITGVGRFEQFVAVVAAEGDEVEVAVAGYAI